MFFNQTFYIKTFGCQMNVHDSERLKSMLSEEFSLTHTEEMSDYPALIILVTCAVRKKAEDKIYSYLGALNKYYQRKGLTPIIGIGGCVAQLDSSRLSKNKLINFIFGTDTLDRVPDLIRQIDPNNQALIKDLTVDPQDQLFSIRTKVSGFSPIAYVTIMKGCNNFCSYCIVPFARGREKSRFISDVVEDVKHLINTGVREIFLLGQNVNSFGKEHNETFTQLIEAIAPLNGLLRLRFTTSNPWDLSDELIECFTPNRFPTLMPNFHLPVQSGNNRILKLMNRRYTRELYLEKVNKLKTIRPDISISTDMIVGFPTETYEEFKDTLSLLETVAYDQVFSFIYSPREGTKATQLEDPFDTATKQTWLAELQEKAMEISLKSNEAQIGKCLKVFLGRSEDNRKVHYAEEKTTYNNEVLIRIQSASKVALKGDMETL